MRINFGDIERKLDRPASISQKAIILLPGVSGNATSDYRFDSLSQALTNQGFYVLRFNIWNSAQELEELTFSDVHYVLDQAIGFLKSFGCTKIGAVGKSFGGGVLLTYSNPDLKAEVLWAPAIGFGNLPTFDKDKGRKLTNFRSLFDIKISASELMRIKIPVLFVQGTADKNVPLAHVEKIKAAVPNSTLEKIEGADHSYEKAPMLREAITKTVEFLRKNVK